MSARFVQSGTVERTRLGLHEVAPVDPLPRKDGARQEAPAGAEVDDMAMLRLLAREEDGLAMSSRNQYLTAEERQRAPVLYRTLCEVAARLRNGESCFTELESGAAQTLRNSGFEPDYIAIRNALTLEVPTGAGTPQVVLAATHEKALAYVDLEDLKALAVDQ